MLCAFIAFFVFMFISDRRTARERELEEAERHSAASQDKDRAGEDLDRER
jgi:hypothetical protein